MMSRIFGWLVAIGLLLVCLMIFFELLLNPFGSLLKTTSEWGPFLHITIGKFPKNSCHYEG